MKINYSILLILLFLKPIIGQCQTSQAYVILGVSKLSANDYRGAIDDFTMAIKRSPKNGVAYSLRATAKGSLGDKKGAVADMNVAIEIEPKNPDFYNGRAAMKLDDQDFNGAIADCNKALELGYNKASVFSCRGASRFAIEDYLGSIADFNKAIELKPNSPNVYYSRGLARILLGLKELGCEDLNKALELGYEKASETIKTSCQNLSIEFVRTFKLGDEYFDVDVLKANDFLAKLPEAIEIQIFKLGKDKFGIPVSKISDFLKDKPNARPLKNYISRNEKIPNSLNTLFNQWSKTLVYEKNKLIYYSLLPKNPELVEVGFENFNDELKDQASRRQLYDKLSNKNPEWKTISFDTFSKEMFPEVGRKEQVKKSPNSHNLKLYNYLINSKRVTLDEVGDFETFDSLLADTTNAIKLHANLLKKGFSIDEIGKLSEFLANIDYSPTKLQPTRNFMPPESLPSWDETTPVDNESVTNRAVNKTRTNTNQTGKSYSHIQIDKIKVGDIFIELPIPTDFVKVDASMGKLMEKAERLVPANCTLLAHYISVEDYATFLSNPEHTAEKYILVEDFKDLRSRKVGGSDFRKLINGLKENYIGEYKRFYDEVGIKAAELLSNPNEQLLVSNFKVQPLGICYESKNIISYSALTKYNVTVDSRNSSDFIVASISTITKLEEKPIILLLNKTYKSKEDIASIKATNLAWIKEIEKNRNNFGFFADFDFEYYKEIILAILTLSIIWAVFAATNKIRKKLNVRVNPQFNIDTEKVNIVDFDDLLVNKDETLIKEDINDSCNNNYIDFDQLLIDNELITTNEELVVKNQIPEKAVNPELLKARRVIRLLNFIIDMIFIYFVISYGVGYALGYLGYGKYVLEHPYLFNIIVIFIPYFFFEYFFGKTLGKWLTGTRVVNSSGGKPTVWQILGRTASRFIPFESLTFLGKQKRGLHDTNSETYVVRDSENSSEYNYTMPNK
ncbi:MAG: tetratricopeptide repeat protein, partial [Mariniphaga sp.]